MNTETLFSFITIGFNLCFCIYLILRYFIENGNKYFIYLAFLSIFFNVFVFIDVLNLTEKFEYLKIVKSTSLSFVVILFYAFMYSFFGSEKSKLLKYALLIGIAFMSFSTLMKILSPYHIVFENIKQLCRSLFMYFDLAILLILFIELYKKRDGYLRFIFYGLSFVIICALAIHFGNSLFNIFDIISHLTILEIEVTVGFCFIFLSILSLEKMNLIKNNFLLETIEAKELQIKQIAEKNNSETIQYNKLTISVQNISFIKSDAHYLDICFQDGTKEMLRGKISEILGMLPTNFKQTHKSYIINTNCIKEKRKDSFLLQNNVEIPLSRTFKPNF